MYVIYVYLYTYIYIYIYIQVLTGPDRSVGATLAASLLAASLESKPS